MSEPSESSKRAQDGPEFALREVREPPMKQKNCQERGRRMTEQTKTAKMGLQSKNKKHTIFSHFYLAQVDTRGLEIEPPGSRQRPRTSPREP